MSGEYHGGRDEREITILILGGWSPGPLPHLLDSIRGRIGRRRIVIFEPTIPMPPVGCSWLSDKGMLALASSVVLMIWSCHAVGGADAFVNRPKMLATTRLIIILGCMGLIRLSIALLVRSCIERGISKAAEVINNRHHNPPVEIVIGFSWGGAVAAEMLRRGLVGTTPGQPGVLLIAPTTALVGTLAIRKDAAFQQASAVETGRIRQQQQEGGRVHVLHASDDGFFCPPPERWNDSSGIVFKLVDDCHIFLRHSSRLELERSLVDLIRGV